MFSRRHPESSAKDVPCFKSCAVWIILLFIGPLMFFIIYSNSIINNEMNRIDNDVMLDKMSFRRTKRAILMPSVRKIRRPRHKLFNSTKSEDPSKKLPSVIIIGVKKGGTRALLTFLRLHPDIRAVGPETHFFDKYYHRGFEWYKNLMPPTVEGQITMEKTPSYFVTKEVPKRIYSMSPTMKLLVVVRDPVTRAVSDYAQTISKRASKPFEKLAFYNHTVGPVDANWSAIKIGLYSKHLSRWLQYFPMNQIHFVSGENLIRSPAEEMRKVQNFLNLQPIITERHFYFNKTKGFPCLKKSRSGGRPKCLGKTKGRVHPKIDAALLNRLKSFYKPFNLKFYKMTGIDFGWNK